jgi:hypothetical protein
MCRGESAEVPLAAVQAPPLDRIVAGLFPGKRPCRDQGEGIETLNLAKGTIRIAFQRKVGTGRQISPFLHNYPIL